MYVLIRVKNDQIKKTDEILRHNLNTTKNKYDENLKTMWYLIKKNPWYKILD